MEIITVIKQDWLSLIIIFVGLYFTIKLSIKLMTDKKQGMGFKVSKWR